MQITLAQRMVWVSATLSNLCILAALVKRRAWYEFPAIWSIETLWIALGWALGLNINHPRYADGYTAQDMVSIVCYIGMICALSFGCKLERGAEYIPQLNFLCAFLILVRYQKGFFGYIEADALRKFISQPTAYWMAFCMFTDRIKKRRFYL